jgi:hypothetical protein
MAWRIDPEGVEPRALARLAPVDGLRVLELGCGDGRLTFRVTREHVVLRRLRSSGVKASSRAREG